jgi:MFS transporter, OFA family, oxalate/formate antiporter
VADGNAMSAADRGLPLPSTLFGRAVFYGWYIVAVACLVSMMSMGVSAYGLGVFITPIEAELGWSRTDISLGQTLATGVMGFAGVMLGGLVDRQGGRFLIVLGAVMAGSAYILLSMVQELWQYYLISGVLLTLGMGLMGAIVLNVVVSNWFLQRRGRAIALTNLGVSFGAILVPRVATWIIETHGWRTAWVVIGVAIWVLVIPSSWFVMRRRPEDHGLVPDGGPVAVGAGNSVAAQRASVDGLRWTRRQVVRTPTLWMLIFVFGFGSVGMMGMLLHMVPFLIDSGYSPSSAAAAFTMVGFSGLMTKPLWGLAVERFQARFVAAAEFSTLGLGVLAVSMAPTLPVMYASIFLFGIGVGGMMTVQETVWADYYGRLTLGMVRSIGRAFTIVFSAAGPLVAGLAYDLRGSYDLAFMVFVGSYVLAAALILLTPFPRHPDVASDGGELTLSASGESVG